jgi:ribosomal protein S18 acetylase RimI-like enzyme
MTVLTRYLMRMAEPDADEVLLGRLQVACWREAYPGLLPRPILDGLDAARIAAGWRLSLRDGIAWIAEQAGEPVGFGHMHGAEVTTLYVRQMDHGRGVGGALLRHLFDEIACLGRREAFLWVLAENHKARAFYARMGGRPVARRSVGYARYPGIMEVRYDFVLDE